MKTRKPWREKMDNPNLPKVIPIPTKMRKRFGNGTMLLPGPREVDALIRTVPRGSVITVSEIRRALAEKHAADITCPLVTGIFVRIVAEATEEAAASGEASLTPYWRVVKSDGSLNPKYPGGVERQQRRLRAEGLRIEQGRGNRPPRVAIVDPPDDQAR